MAALFQEVRRCFAEHQLPTPNYRTVVKRVAAIDPRLAMTKRDGAKAARDKFGPVGVSRLRPERLMEVLQIDHTPVDVIVVDQEQRRPIGRPWLTLPSMLRADPLPALTFRSRIPRPFPSRWCSPMRFYPKRPGSPTASFTRSTGLWEDFQHRSMLGLDLPALLRCHIHRSPLRHGCPECRDDDPLPFGAVPAVALVLCRNCGAPGCCHPWSSCQKPE